MKFVNRKLTTLALFVVFSAVVSSQPTPVPNSDSVQNLKIIRNVYERCEASDDFLKCLKIQALKFADRALHLKSFNLTDGITVIRTKDADSRSMNQPETAPLKEKELESFSDDKINEMLYDRSQKFIESHQVKFSLPDILNEGRGKKNKGMGGLLLVGAAMKAMMLKAAFMGVAALAGKALVIGKIALVLSAIIGLKKLVSSDHHEKTTYEIVKHPHVSHSNTYSSSHYGDFDEGGIGGGSGGHYHRSLDSSADMSMQDKAYNGWKPKKF